MGPGWHAGNIRLVGGALCLDFANIVGHRPTDHPTERLHRYADLVDWSRHARIISDRQGRDLLRQAARRPGRARTALAQAIGLREAIAWVFYAASRGTPPKRVSLGVLNAALARALRHRRVRRNASRFQWAWSGQARVLDWMLWPIALSAAELLTSDRLRHVRECAMDGCGWLFLDDSRNRQRRWCTMDICGNRAKARRHYRRRKVRSRRSSDHRQVTRGWR